MQDVEQDLRRDKPAPFLLINWRAVGHRRSRVRTYDYAHPDHVRVFWTGFAHDTLSERAHTVWSCEAAGRWGEASVVVLRMVTSTVISSSFRVRYLPWVRVQQPRQIKFLPNLKGEPSCW